jgi:trigger factor
MSFVYRGLKADLQRHIVTDEEIEKQLERILQQNPKIETVTDREARLGDEVILDYAGYCDGEQFAGGTAENQTLELGSGAFIPGFEEQLVGKQVGDEVNVQVTFPEVYHSEALAGKAAEFKCKIHQIRVKTPYELDDTFAKEVGGCENLEQMRQKMGESMQAYIDQRGEMDLQDKLLRQAAETLDFEPSEEQIDAEVENQMQNMAAQLAQQGMDLEMYCSFTGNTQEKLRADARDNARTTLRLQVTIERIAELEKMEATEGEIDEAMAIVAKQNGLTLEQLRAYCDEEFKQAITKSILASKVMQLIRQHAEIE